jgi:hypothetical protein
VARLSIVHREQVRQMWRWYAISKAHTIYLTDFDGQKYEGIISSLTMARKGKLQSTGRDAVDARSTPYEATTSGSRWSTSWSVTFTTWA